MDKRPIMNKWYTRFLSVALILAVVCGMSWPGKIMVADAEEGGTTVVTAGDIVSGEVTPGNAADGGSVVDTGADGDTNEAEASLAEQYLGEIAALMAEAQLIDGTSADVTLKCADVYERLMGVYAEAVEAKDAGEITAEEYEEIYSATGEVIGYLYSEYGYDPYAVAITADITVEQGGNENYSISNVRKKIYGAEIVSVVNSSNNDAESYFKVEGRNNGEIRVTADDDTPVGTYTITVSYRTDGSETRTVTFTVEVTASNSDDNNQSGSYPLLQSNYQGTALLYYDIMVPDESATVKYSGYNGTDARVSSVTLGSSNTAVVKADSDSSSKGWSDGKALSNYYGSDLTSSSTAINAPLIITPASGYYVKKVVIACCHQGNKPYNCDTWKYGNAYTESFSVGTGGAVTIQVPSNAFGHSSKANYYFILIEVAPIPSPLYVEYDYGTIVGILEGADLGTTPFDTPNGWTNVASGNNYGTIGEPDTQYTQYKYAYPDSTPEAAANWVHNANSITRAAKIKAAEAGYYFTGWKAEYYTTCDSTQITSPTYNNYTYSFTESYGSANYTEGATVTLTTNVRLIAQWEPVKLNVTKTVAGLKGTDFEETTNTYQIKVEKLTDSETRTWTQQGDVMSFTVTGDGVSDAQTISPVTPGTYRVVETGNGGNLEDTTKKIIMYLSVSDGGSVSVSAENIIAGTTEYSLNVTNTYSESVPGLKLVKKWQDADGTVISADTDELPSVSFTVKSGDTLIDTYELNSENDWVRYVKLGSQYAGAELTITENITGSNYELLSIIKEEETVEQTIDGTKCVCTVYTATNKRAVTDITVVKKVSGSMGDQSKEFEFEAQIVDGGKVYKLSSGTGYTVREDGTISFSLKHNEQVKLVKVPLGAELWIKETNANGYTITISGATASDGWYKVPVSKGAGSNDMTVTVSNYKDINPDTGVLLDSLPYVLILIIVIAGVVVMFIRKRRSYDED